MIRPCQKMRQKKPFLSEGVFENSKRFHALKDFSAAYWGIISFL